MNARTKLALMVLFLLALLLAGCSGATIRILPDVQFGRQAGDAPRTIVQHPRPVETRPQDVTVDKLVFVELPREFSSAAGTVFHILEHGCGLIAVKAPTPAGYRKGFVFQNPKPVPPHKYRLEFAVSSRTLLGTRRTGEEYVQADANLFDEQNVVAQSGQFVRTGGGIGYYGRGRDALGNPIYEVGRAAWGERGGISGGGGSFKKKGAVGVGVGWGLLLCALRFLRGDVLPARAAVSATTVAGGTRSATRSM